MPTWLLIAVLVLALAGCARDDKETITVYFLDGHLSPLGYRGQLTPVEREIPAVENLLEAAVLELLRGPAEAERKDGLLSPLAGTRLVATRTEGARVVVELAGTSTMTVEAGGQLLYTLTELPEIRWVSLRFNGKPCCFGRHSGDAIDPASRLTLRYWSGEPCHLRTTPTHVRCAPAPG